ncbi:ethanolamine ammonia-lyase subunit EutC [Sinorhizobium sp. BG8]|uniref:ethanolamine ammonia-lyase subunit EutC n=1 Tax=Sinorhizobium sp. BG8 TaxID=2613773 RepID=UPI00193EA744|nr:ethanolamine ammonia-lyase subunit EutC [Sinorhizobium sp. BG8]QRM57465.1 ethanolamine ammonia-lyase subunit EutC [Sinorhizobium sp. BG8]
MADSLVKKRAASVADLKEMTDARVALGRFGAGTPTRAAQAFLLDHARAREAVWSTVDHARLRRGLEGLPIAVIDVESQAEDRSSYVRRPDLGRKLSPASTEKLLASANGFDVVVVIADGLSSSAVDINAAPLVRSLVERLMALGLSVGPVVIASQARVALADPVGEALDARVAIMLIGERPGLSAADSLGAYLTHTPRAGTPDSRRNCVSNIREGGLSVEAAAETIVGLVTDMMRAGISGVGLKEAVGRLAP